MMQKSTPQTDIYSNITRYSINVLLHWNEHMQSDEHIYAAMN